MMGRGSAIVETGLQGCRMEYAGNALLGFSRHVVESPRTNFLRTRAVPAFREVFLEEVGLVNVQIVLRELFNRCVDRPDA